MPIGTKLLDIVAGVYIIRKFLSRNFCFVFEVFKVCPLWVGEGIVFITVVDII